jgi:hypothetical protein
MSSLKQIKSEIKSYFSKTHRNKPELIRFTIIALFSYFLTVVLTGSFNSSLGYDVRGEFSGYLILLSFFSFLFIAFRYNTHGLRFLSCCHVVVCITNFLILKSILVPFLLKLFVCYTSIFLLLVILREIKNRA